MFGVAGFLHFPVSMIGRWVLGVLPQLFHVVYNLLLALDFLLRSLSPQGLWDGCQPMLTVGWSKNVHPVMERGWSDYASAVLSLNLCLQFHLCSCWMSKLQGRFSPCLFQSRMHSCTYHSLWIFSFAPCLEKRFFRRGLEEAVSVCGETFSLENIRWRDCSRWKGACKGKLCDEENAVWWDQL